MKSINENYIKDISIQGFRGFKEKQKIEFSYPNSQCKSGLNIIVGQNCSGKSTILETIKLLMKTNKNGYFLSKAMKHSNIALKIDMNSVDSRTILETNNVENYAEIKNSGDSKEDKNYFLVPARKNVYSNNIYVNSQSIETFLMNYNTIDNQTINRRKNNMSNDFISILSAIYTDNRRKNKFDEILHKFSNNVSWSLYMSDEQTNAFIVDIIDNCGETHFEGVGDGIITIIYIAVGLLLLEENLVNVLLIDEPEVSLHVEIIKKIKNVLREYAKKYQIIISTHSPYLIDWDSIKDGGKLIRTVNENEIKTYELDNSLVNNLTMNPASNPHIYGITAKEVFFLKDNIILVEGQEDVVCYKKIAEKLNLNKEYNFYGWGVGGAKNMINIMRILKNLGYKKVVAIFDGDSTSIEEAKSCAKNINDDKTIYKIVNIMEQDVRDKYKTIYDDITLEKKDEILYKSGICDKDYKIKQNFDKDYRIEMIRLFNDIDLYFDN